MLIHMQSHLSPSQLQSVQSHEEDPTNRWFSDHRNLPPGGGLVTNDYCLFCAAQSTIRPLETLPPVFSVPQLHSA